MAGRPKATHPPPTSTAVSPNEAGGRSVCTLRQFNAEQGYAQTEDRVVGARIRLDRTKLDVNQHRSEQAPMEATNL